MSWQALLIDLTQAQQSFDRQIEHQSILARDSRVAIFCEKGCSNCCSLAVNCSYPEAVAIAQSLDSQQQDALRAKIVILQEISLESTDLKDFLQRFRQKMAGCPWLDSEQGHCLIYPQRPFSCRSLLSTRNSSWCGVDFSTLHPMEKEAFLSSLDPELVAFPTHYLAASQELGLDFESQLLVTMRERFGVSLTGNLLYLVWLELEYSLSEILSNGVAATEDFLQHHQLDLPFLLLLT